MAIGRRIFVLFPLRRALSSCSLVTIKPSPPPVRVLRSIGKNGLVQPRFQREALSFRRLLEERRWDSSVQCSLRDSCIPVSDEISEEVMKTLSEAKHALRFFIWVAESGRFHLSPRSIGVLARRWSHEIQFNDFLRVIQLRNEPLTADDYLTLMTGYGWAGMVDKALEALKAMKRLGIQRDLLHFACVINTVLREGRQDTIHEVYKDMTQTGFYPDAEMCNKLVTELCVAGFKEQGLEILQEMKMKGLNIKRETYLIASSVFSKASRPVEVLLIISEFLQDGYTPDVKISNHLLKAFCLSGGVNEAFETLMVMLAKGVRPNLVSLGMVFDGLLEAVDMEKAFCLWKMLDKDSIPMSSFQEKLVRELCNADKLEEAEKVIDYLKERKAPISSTMYSSLIFALCRSGNAPRACKFVLDASHEHKSETYSALIRHLIKGDNISDASKVFDHMMEHGVKVDFTTYHFLLIAFCKVGETEKVELLLDWIKKSCNSVESEMYYSSVSKLCQPKKLVEAAEVLQEMIELNLLPCVEREDKFVSMVVGNNGVPEEFEIDEAVVF